MFELHSSVVVVVLAWLVADFIVNEGIGELKLLRNILDAIELESSGIGDAIAEASGALLILDSLGDLLYSEDVAEALQQMSSHVSKKNIFHVSHPSSYL